MAVTDQQFQQLLNSLNDLTRTIKQDKNSFGSQTSDSGGTRMSRGGSANGRAIRESNKAVEALAENLQDLHKSFKSGGRTIADHFKEMVKNINPLNAAFGKLEDAVKDAADTHTKAYNQAAKHTLEYVK
jgi:phage-related protein